ncbi:MAG: DUF4870 domain-containing protein [Dehalococcoidales bacterium]|nr:DUF4870 domain-containing protein [Dehalococcoidales bacterium]
MGPTRGKASTVREPNLAGLLCYAFFWVGGLLFLLLEKEDKFVRFHAMQSVVTFGAITVVFALVFIPIVGWVFGWILWALVFVLWVVLMIKAYQGAKYKMPIAGDFAEKQA